MGVDAICLRDATPFLPSTPTAMLCLKVGRNCAS
jgi:hypothetical protein